MGRPRKGKVAGVSPRGRPVRVAERLEQLYYPLKSKPHGKSATVWDLTTFLKERVPLVYAFIVGEKEKEGRERDPRLQRIIEDLNQKRRSQKRPSSRALTAYVIERAMEGAWQIWGLKAPYSAGNHDAFYRRYVHGHRGALRVLRSKLSERQPWNRHHVGHEVKWFLGKPGAAASHYSFLTPAPMLVPVLRITEEE